VTPSGPPRILAIMGSGETAPTLRKTHERILARVPAGVPRLLLETPYGFQENAPQLTAKTLEWFSGHVGHPLEPAGLGRLDGDDPLARERGLRRLAGAGYVFSGPGSPSFALRQWIGSPVADRFAAMLREGGALVLSSAAALTLGVATVPVYEVYKAGEEPFWLPGLDLLTPLGLPVAVVPHWDNAEGAEHDTSHCFMGERRMAQLEAMLPPGTWMLGVDEHTAAVLDLDADTVAVEGRGAMTVRVAGVETRHPAGSVLPLGELRAVSGSAAAPATAAEETIALPEADVDRSARAVLDCLAAAAAEPDPERRREMLAAARAGVARLADLAAAEPAPAARETVAPLVESLLEVRRIARAEKRWELSDLVRDRLAAAGVTVRDTPAGAEWELAG